jgi:hypothetical protein
MFEERRTVTYTFSYSGDIDPESLQYPVHTRANKNITVNDESTWRVPMREFANFLSGIYGYNITEQVFVKSPFDEDFVGLEGAE